MSARPAARGMILMVMAIFTFTAMEVFVKLVSQDFQTVQILWFRYAIQLVLTLAVITPRFRAVIKTKYPKLQLLRAVLLMMATASFYLGYQRNSLVETNAIAQTAPIFITLGAVLFLGERIGRHRSISVGVGLLGALIILRPGTDGFSAWLLFPMMGALFYSGYALATRFVGRNEDVWTSLLYTALISTVFLSLFTPFVWRLPEPNALVLLICVGLCGSVAQLFLTMAFATSEASALAPLSYISLIFSSIWGIIFFNHYPDAPVYIGALVIVAAGLYVWHRETQAKV